MLVAGRRSREDRKPALHLSFLGPKAGGAGRDRHAGPLGGNSFLMQDLGRLYVRVGNSRFQVLPDFSSGELFVVLLLVCLPPPSFFCRASVPPFPF